MPVIEGYTGKYEIEEPIGSGYFGQVFRAKDLTSQRTVALKILLENHLNDHKKVREFKKEGGVQLKLDHPNIIEVYDSFEFEGKPYIAMEWAQQSLKNVLDTEERLEPERAIEIAGSILEALVYAHSKGITHLDIHPGNVLFNNGIPKLTDFGLARIFWQSKEGKEILDSQEVSLSAEGTFQKTPLLKDSLSIAHTFGKKPASGIESSLVNFFTYAPPELIDQNIEVTKEIATRADIYSASMVLYKMLTGKLDRQRLGLYDEDWSEINLERIVELGMHGDYKKRYSSAQEMLEKLEKWDKSTIPTRVYHTPQKIPKKTSSHIVLPEEKPIPITIYKKPHSWTKKIALGLGVLLGVGVLAYLPHLKPIRSKLLNKVLDTYERNKLTHSQKEKQTKSQTLQSLQSLEGKIAFVSDRDGHKGIYTLDSSGIKRLTSFPKKRWTGTVDGNTLNFESHSHSYDPIWSKNGKKIAFFSDRIRNKMEIYIMNSNGSDIKQLTNNFARRGNFDWSPNGKEIIYISGVHKIYKININGKNLTKLTEDKYGDISPKWSPDGTKIAFQRRGKDSNIYIMNANGSNSRRLTNFTNNYSNELNLKWSPDGKEIVFTQKRNRNQGICVMDIEGSNIRRLTNNRDTNPKWSPDGTKIVFQRRIISRPPDIYIMNSNGSNQVNLTNNPAGDYNPSWSPDGTKIAFDSNRDNRNKIINYEVYIMNQDGSNVQRLTNNPAKDTNPIWCPVK